MINPASVLFGTVIGGFVAWAARQDEKGALLLEQVKVQKPPFYKTIILDMAVARSEVEFNEVADFIIIDNQDASVICEIRLNEPSFEKLDLRKYRKLQGTIWRFYITNEAGAGSIKLLLCRGLAFLTEDTGPDIGELATRLGSIVTFDRRGDIIFYDNFESDVLKWIYSQTGSGGELVATAERAKTNGFCAKLSTGGASGNLGTMTKRISYQALSKIGFEVSFTLNDNLSEYLFTAYLYDSVNYYAIRLRYITATDQLEVDNNGSWVVIATGIKTFTNTYLFNTIKIVADFAGAKKYERVILNEIEYDISAYNLRTASSAIGRHLSIEIQLTTGVASSQVSYIADAIITQNEP